MGELRVRYLSDWALERLRDSGRVESGDDPAPRMTARELCVFVATMVDEALEDAESMQRQEAEEKG